MPPPRRLRKASRRNKRNSEHERATISRCASVSKPCEQKHYLTTTTIQSKRCEKHDTRKLSSNQSFPRSPFRFPLPRVSTLTNSATARRLLTLNHHTRATNQPHHNHARTKRRRRSRELEREKSRRERLCRTRGTNAQNDVRDDVRGE